MLLRPDYLVKNRNRRYVPHLADLHVRHRQPALWSFICDHHHDGVVEAKQSARRPLKLETQDRHRIITDYA